MYFSLLFIVPISLFFCVCVYNRFFHPLRHVPGPLGGSLSDLYRLYLLVAEHIPTFNVKLHEHYGPVVRVTPSLVSISDPEVMATVYTRTADKSTLYTHGALGEKPPTVQILGHREHAAKRRLISPLLSMKNVRVHEDKLDQRILELQHKLASGIVSTKNGLEFTERIRWFLLDTVTHAIFEKPAGFMLAGGDVRNMLSGLRDMTFVALMLGSFPWVMRPILSVPLLRRKLIPQSHDSWGSGRMLMFCREQLNRRRAYPSEKSNAFLDILLEIQSRNRSIMDDEDVATECLMLMVAALDSTAGLICPLINNLVQNPAAYQRLMHEIQSFEEVSLLSLPVATYDETCAMPYFMACIQETIRYVPSIPVILPRYAPEGGLVINGVHIPGGTEIGANPFVINRDKRVFGEDADIFRPERWLEDAERTRKMEKTVFTFGTGSRECLGIRFAKFEVQKVALQLLRTFEFSLGIQDGPWAIHEDRGFAIYEQQWLRLRLRKDEKKPV